MSSQNFEVQGLADLERALLELGAETGFKTLRSAARKAMKPVLDDAQQNAREDTGDMKASLAIRVRKGKGSRAVTVSVGSFRRKLTVRDGDSKTTRTLNRQHQKVIAQEYGTSEIMPKPFLRPALANNAQTVIDTFKAELAKSIARVVRKQANKK